MAKKNDKEEVEYFTDDGHKDKLADFIGTLTDDARDLTLGFLPEEAKKHIINMNKEALAAIKSVIEESAKILKKQQKKE